jgi:hypothetical protein
LYSGRGAVGDWYLKRQARRRSFELSIASQTSRAAASECEKSVPRLDVAQVTSELQIGCWLHNPRLLKGAPRRCSNPQPRRAALRCAKPLLLFARHGQSLRLQAEQPNNTMKTNLDRTHVVIAASILAGGLFMAGCASPGGKAASTSSIDSPTRFTTTDGRTIDIGKATSVQGGTVYNNPDMEKGKCWVANGFDFRPTSPHPTPAKPWFAKKTPRGAELCPLV